MMKRWMKITSLLTLLAMCCSLCGCVDLDEIRASRATVTENGTILVADGSEYKLLPECADLVPGFEGGEIVYIVDEEIPLLLTGMSGSGFSKSDDGWFLQADSGGVDAYYCRTDVYNDILARIQNGFQAELCGYWDYDYEQECSMFYELDQEQSSAILEVYGTAKPEPLPDGVTPTYDAIVDLVSTTKDKLFTRDTMDIGVLNGKYYVVDYDGDAAVLYRVPSSLTDTFRGILEMYWDSDKYVPEW